MLGVSIQGKQKVADFERGLQGGVVVKLVQGIIGNLIGLDKFREVEVMQSFKRGYEGRSSRTMR